MSRLKVNRTANLLEVPRPSWADAEVSTRESVDWFFEWYGRVEGPRYAKEPPLAFPFTLIITTGKPYGAIICEVDRSEKGWRYLDDHERAYWAYGAVPRAKEIVESLNAQGGSF